MTLLSPIIPANQLADRLDDPHLLIVDVSAGNEFASAHIPGAVRIDYADLVTSNPPVMGLVADSEQLSRAFSAIGLTADRHVIAYDREGGGKAGRLLFTLDAIGHTAGSLLDGGLQAWVNADLPLHSGDPAVTPSDFDAVVQGHNIADKAHILEHLGGEDMALVDSRSPGEFNGSDLRAVRGGHIPGAVNFNWTDAFDPDNPPSLRDQAALRQHFVTLGVTPDKEVIAYCQTHHRSSHTYMLLKQLGYTNVKGYPGAWSEWGNDPDTPIEQ